jgi:hypothetical protein
MGTIFGRKKLVPIDEKEKLKFNFIDLNTTLTRDVHE